MTADARPRILFVAHTAGFGGPTNSLLMLVRHLKDRYDLGVLLPEEGQLGGLLAAENVPHFTIPTLRARTIPQIRHLICEGRFDLVYGNNPGGGSRNAMLAAKLARRPFVWHFRGVKWHWTWRKGVFLRGADAVVAVSQACASSIQRFYPRPVHVVYNGVEPHTFGGDRIAARRHLDDELGLSPRARCVIGVSHVEPRKGHEQAMAVTARLAAEMDDVHLLVAGSLDRRPAYASRIKTMISEQGLENCVHLLGLRTDVPQLLLGADVFLHTANRDPHPRAVIEAMASWLPVVAFAVDGVTETVVDGETGFLLPWGDTVGLADAVVALLQDPDRAAEMGRRGRERVRSHFTADRTAAQVAQVIDRLLEKQ